MLETGLPATCNLFHSSAVDGEMAQLLGAPHYSYRFAEDRFLAMFRAHAMPPARLRMPEYYATPDAFPPGAIDPALPSVHLIFRSTEQLRLLKFAVNVCCFAWEFDVLKDGSLPGEHPFLNQARMLRLCEEVWVPSEYTARVLRRHGLERVVTIPAPIPADAPRVGRAAALASLGSVAVATLAHNFLLSRPANRALCEGRTHTLLEWLAPRLQTARPSIYLAVLNPEDFRKNLDPMLRGFAAFAAGREDAVLLVKCLTSASRFPLLDVVSDVIAHKFANGTTIESDSVAFFNAYLSETQMTALYSLADFYLCTSVAEGQNLPLLEAMAHATVPVTTANTAMLDYIDPAHAVVINAPAVPSDTVHLAGSVAGRPFSVHKASPEDVHAALVASHALAPEARGAMGRAASAVVRRRYAQEAVWPLVQERIGELTRAMGQAA